MTGIEYVIKRLEIQKAAIEKALTSLREVDGDEAPTPKQAVTETTVIPAGNNRRSNAQKKRWALSALRHVDGIESSATKAAADAVAAPSRLCRQCYFPTDAMPAQIPTLQSRQDAFPKGV